MKKNKENIASFLSEEKIKKRISELGKKISDDFKNEDIVIIGVLKGSFIFLADLVREIKVPCKIEFIGVSSYEGTESTGHVRITHDLSAEVMNKNVVLVEDIVDTGKTIDYLSEMIRMRSPKSFKLCALLSKPDKHELNQKIDYLGFEIGNEFVVGYGLDYDGMYRELPYIGVLKC